MKGLDFTPLQVKRGQSAVGKESAIPIIIGMLALLLAIAYSLSKRLSYCF